MVELWTIWSIRDPVANHRKSYATVEVNSRIERKLFSPARLEVRRCLIFLLIFSNWFEVYCSFNLLHYWSCRNPSVCHMGAESAVWLPQLKTFVGLVKNWISVTLVYGGLVGKFRIQSVLLETLQIRAELCTYLFKILRRVVPKSILHLAGWSYTSVASTIFEWMAKIDSSSVSILNDVSRPLPLKQDKCSSDSTWLSHGRKTTTTKLTLRVLRDASY